MRRILSVMLVALLSVSLIACGKKNPEEGTPETVNNEKQELNISAAASLRDCAVEIASLYNKDNPNVEILYNFGASGTLQQQIEQGSPTDIFISAGKKQMEALDEKNLLLENTKADLLANSLVLITPLNSKEITLADLTTNEVTKIAVGEPESVPAGQYTAEVFEFLGITEEIKEKLIFAKDVTEVRTWVETENVDVGFVYKTDALISDKVKIIEETPAKSHKPIIYPVAIIKDTKQEDLSKDFISFLRTDEVKKIFEKYGFGMAD